MKHLLDITKFLSEALTPYYKKKYKPYFVNRPPEVIARLNNLLDNEEKVYIPYESDTISETQLKVKSYLEENGYTIQDYKQNLAVQIENSKRQIRISKLLAKNPELLKEFTLDDTRANAKASSGMSIVLTSNYEDVAGMSFDRCWTNSCLNIKEGCNKHYVKDEVKQGTIVAYLIESKDINIENPLGRVNIKPFYSKLTGDEKEVLYVTDIRVYGNVPDEKLFKEIINQYLKEKQEVRTIGFYQKVDGVYSDTGSPPVVSIGKDYKVCYDCTYDEEGYNRFGYDEEGFNREGYDKYGMNRNGSYPYQEHITRDQFRYLKDLLGNGKWSVDNKGLVNVEGSVNLSGRTDNGGVIPVKFGIVTGYFTATYCNLTSLEGTPREVGMSFDCSSNKLTNLGGGPLKVGGNYEADNNELTSLDGSPIEVIKNFIIYRNNLKSLEGGPKKVGGNYSVYRNSLISLMGAPEKVGGDFDCSNNELKDLLGAPPEILGKFEANYNQLESLKGGPIKVGENYEVENNQLTSLLGAPQEIPGGSFLCRWNKLKTLEGIPTYINNYFNCNYQPVEFMESEIRELSNIRGYVDCGRIS